MSIIAAVLALAFFIISSIAVAHDNNRWYNDSHYDQYGHYGNYGWSYTDVSKMKGKKKQFS